MEYEIYGVYANKRIVQVASRKGILMPDVTPLTEAATAEERGE
jgi:hypothetical protein